MQKEQSLHPAVHDVIIISDSTYIIKPYLSCRSIFLPSKFTYLCLKTPCGRRLHGRELCQRNQKALRGWSWNRQTKWISYLCCSAIAMDCRALFCLARQISQALEKQWAQIAEFFSNDFSRLYSLASKKILNRLWNISILPVHHIGRQRLIPALNDPSRQPFGDVIQHVKIQIVCGIIDGV